MLKQINCPHCKKSFSCFSNPAPTVDVIIYEKDKGIVIIKRKNVPLGYALPGGFIDEGEQAEDAAKREMLEETGLEIKLLGLLGVYSNPARDLRRHTISMVFVGKPYDCTSLKAGDDAADAAFYKLDHLPYPLVFDHQKILDDFKDYLEGKRSLANTEK